MAPGKNQQAKMEAIFKHSGSIVRAAENVDLTLKAVVKRVEDNLPALNQLIVIEQTVGSVNRRLESLGRWLGEDADLIK